MKIEQIPIIPMRPHVQTDLWADYYCQTKRYLSVLAIFFALQLTNTCSAQAVDSNKIVNSVTKCWRAFSYEYSTIYGLEEDEIKSYAKQKVCFTKDSITMYNNILYMPKYLIKKVDAENYAKSNFDCAKRKLGIIVDSVFEITISSLTKSPKDAAKHKMTDVIAFDGECIFIVVDGVIFKLLDADARVRPRSSN